MCVHFKSWSWQNAKCANSVRYRYRLSDGGTVRYLYNWHTVCEVLVLMATLWGTCTNEDLICLWIRFILTCEAWMPHLMLLEYIFFLKNACVSCLASGMKGFMEQFMIMFSIWSLTYLGILWAFVAGKACIVTATVSWHHWLDASAWQLKWHNENLHRIFTTYSRIAVNDGVGPS